MGNQFPGGSHVLKMSKMCWMCDTWCLAGPVIRVKLTVADDQTKVPEVLWAFGAEEKAAGGRAQCDERPGQDA